MVNEPSFYERMSLKEMRHADQLIYSMHMITEIAEAYNDTVDKGHHLCARSMLDAFYVHIRLLGDFLIKDTKARLDFGPADFGVSWEKPTSTAAERLADHWGVASKFVVHFAHPRVPDDLTDLEPFEIGSAPFAEMARDALEVMERFISAVEAEAAKATDEPARLSVPRLRASSLRTAFEHACARVRVDRTASSRPLRGS